MSWKHWLFTALSFAAAIAVSVYVVVGRADAEGAGHVTLALPLVSHVLAALAMATEIVMRSLKIAWSARAVRIRLPFRTALRTSLAGDFGGAITPARSGAEPARYLMLAESGVGAIDRLVILYAELFLEALSLGAVVVVVAIVFRHAGPVLGALVGVVGGYAGFVLGLGALAVMLARRNASGPVPRWARRLRVGAGMWRRIQRGLRQVRTTVDAVRDVNVRVASLAFLASVMHVAIRLVVLPALVLPLAPRAPLAPLALWPLGFLYGAAVVPAPGGGGAVELAFRAALGGTIPPRLFGAALLWWRFYTFYVYIGLGALVAGGTALRAVRREREVEQEVEQELLNPPRRRHGAAGR